MNAKLSKVLVAAFAWVGAISVLDVTAFISIPGLPADVIKIVALVPVTAAAVYHTFKPLIDRLGIVPAVGMFLGVGSISALTLSLSACTLPAGWSVDFRTPHGDVVSDAGGGVTVIPRPIVVPQK